MKLPKKKADNRKYASLDVLARGARNHVSTKYSQEPTQQRQQLREQVTLVDYTGTSTRTSTKQHLNCNYFRTSLTSITS